VTHTLYARRGNRNAAQVLLRTSLRLFAAKNRQNASYRRDNIFAKPPFELAKFAAMYSNVNFASLSHFDFGKDIARIRAY